MFGHDNDQHTNAAYNNSSLPEPAVDDILSAPSPSVPSDQPSLAPSSSSSAAYPDDDLANLRSSTPSSSSDELLGIKQQALQQLTPLVGHLDQTPEERFRTTMMMIQGADNQSLIKDAYAAAQQITDEKARAQALLDIVNEINYFTQHTS